MSYRREIPKLNKGNFVAWQGLMRLHMETISNSSCQHLDIEYKTPSRTLSVEDITSTLSYVEFDEVKDQTIAHAMWIKLKDIYGGDENVRRAKA